MKRFFFKRLLVLPCVIILLSLSLIVSPPVARAASSVSLSPNQGPAGTQVTATGSDWSAGHTINVTWEGQSGNLAQTTVDGNGKFTVPFTVPSNAKEGRHTVYFIDATGNVGYFIPATFTVTATSTRTLTIESVFTTDGNRNYKSTFLPRDSMFYVVYINNNSSQPMNVALTFGAWLTSDENKRAIDANGVVNAPVGLSGWGWSAIIPDNAPSGEYTYRAIAKDTSQGNSCASGIGCDIKQTTFTVTSKLSTTTFRLPWDATKSLKFTGGPHAWTGTERSGLDFSSGSTNTHVLAMESGIVTFVGQEACKDGSCNTVKIRHDNGLETWYVHLSSFAPKIAKDVHVSQGTWIGNEGGHGTTAIHIHIELRSQGKPVSWDGMTLEGWQIHQGCDGYNKEKNTKQNKPPCYPTNYDGYINKGSEQAVPLSSGPQLSLQSSNRESKL